jgi:hypothetical protein
MSQDRAASARRCLPRTWSIRRSAGHSARFLTAADLILDLISQDTAGALQRRLRTYLRPSLVAIDEVGYLAYDVHAARSALSGGEPALRTIAARRESGQAPDRAKARLVVVVEAASTSRSRD